MPIQKNGTILAGIKTQEQFDQCGLARTISSNQGKFFSLRYVQINTIQHLFFLFFCIVAEKNMTKFNIQRIFSGKIFLLQNFFCKRKFYLLLPFHSIFLCLIKKFKKPCGRRQDIGKNEFQVQDGRKGCHNIGTIAKKRIQTSHRQFATHNKNSANQKNKQV